MYWLSFVSVFEEKRQTIMKDSGLQSAKHSESDYAEHWRLLIEHQELSLSL